MINCKCICNKAHSSTLKITEDMIGKHSVNINGNVIMLSSSIGYVQKIDVGKTLYLREGILKMDYKSKEQA